MTDPAPPAQDVAAELRAGLAALAAGRPVGDTAHPGATSDLSVDEVLLLHAAGWEPAALVAGYAIHSVPTGWWAVGMGEIAVLSHSATNAFFGASTRLRAACSHHGAAGVVGVKMELEQQTHTTSVQLIGTAIRRIDDARHGGSSQPGTQPFLSDLSARDFTLLEQAGWGPLGIAFGAAHIRAPYRGGMTAVRQSGQNVELTNLTEALVRARTAAMARMQSSATQVGATGVVGVSVTEGPLRAGGHAVRFLAWGTAVALHAAAHRAVRPLVTLSLDDREVAFQATSLRAD